MPRKPRDYPLEVRAMIDHDGGYAGGYYSKGKHSASAFSMAVYNTYDVKIPLARVRYGYFRNTWQGDGAEYMTFQYLDAPAAGAYPVTYWEQE